MLGRLRKLPLAMVGVTVTLLVVIVLVIAIQYRDDTSPFVAEDLNLSLVATDNRSIVVGRISADDNPTFPTSLTFHHRDTSLPGVGPAGERCNRGLCHLSLNHGRRIE